MPTYGDLLLGTWKNLSLLTYGDQVPGDSIFLPSYLWGPYEKCFWELSQSSVYFKGSSSFWFKSVWISFFPPESVCIAEYNIDDEDGPDRRHEDFDTGLAYNAGVPVRSRAFQTSSRSFRRIFVPEKEWGEAKLRKGRGKQDSSPSPLPLRGFCLAPFLLPKVCMAVIQRLCKSPQPPMISNLGSHNVLQGLWKFKWTLKHNTVV